MRHTSIATAGCVLIVALASPASIAARYGIPQLEQVPIDRLVTNLARMVAAEPTNLELRNNLARAHAMAFAARTATVTVPRNDERAGPYTSPEGPYIPFASASANRGTLSEMEARQHLRAAIDAYEQLLRLDPSRYVSRLGYAWCLEQSGLRERAVAEYRRVVREASQKESSTRDYDALRGPVTDEAIGYLLPLLDPTRDTAEIAQLRSMYRVRGGRMVTPIAIPLSADVPVDRLVDRHARVRFDADGAALGGEWNWISKDAGWLVYDREGKGTVSSALQLFGSVTFWMFWSTGYDALRALDDDGDGVLRGDELRDLAIWNDANGNGISDAGEVLPVEQWGIVSISCAQEIEAESDFYVASSARGVTFTDGATRPTYDLLLQKRSEPSHTVTGTR
jgi:tetratricopeptide (TPR) repeat protein